MKYKTAFRGFGAYRAVGFGFGIYHELFLNPTLNEWIQNGESSEKIALGYCLAFGVSSVLSFGLIDGIVDVVKGSLEYLPLKISGRIFSSERKNLEELTIKMLELREKEI